MINDGTVGMNVINESMINPLWWHKNYPQSEVQKGGKNDPQKGVQKHPFFDPPKRAIFGPPGGAPRGGPPGGVPEGVPKGGPKRGSGQGPTGT